MPTIAIIDGVKVVIYYNDHAPPHFHAIIAENEVQIDIRTLIVLRGSMPPAQLRRVLAWARDNQGELALRWINAQADEEI